MKIVCPFCLKEIVFWKYEGFKISEAYCLNETVCVLSGKNLVSLFPDKFDKITMHMTLEGGNE